MEVRYTADDKRLKTMTTKELRDSFLVDSLFEAGQIKLVYTDVDRAIVGSAVPTGQKLALVGSKELASEYFAQRREVGVINVGAKGTITVDGRAYALENRDCLYIGRGSKTIELESAKGSDPALFYILSYPASADYPTTHACKADATMVKLGSPQTANERTIYKYIHPAKIKSCQLVMGFTELAQGSVWNTMPPHTHERRTEVYFYFDIPEGACVFHLMGQADESRHIVMNNRQVVISPSWSMHSGVGTASYTFIWGMGGENQDFDDMDHIAVKDLK
jgi:4-deoxy-L-threo-5-hexosulose-uronate ketol-isomerase